MSDDTVFPPEIFQSIIEDLVSDDAYQAEAIISDLQSLCLVSKFFVPITRPHIFRTVTLNMTCDPSRRIDLLNLFLKSPHIAGCVHKLIYRCVDTDEDEEQTSLDAWVESFQLPNLTHLNIRTRRGLVRNYEREEAATFGHKRLLEHYLQFHTLTEISVYGILMLPILLLLASRTLRVLRLEQCSVYLPSLPLPKNPLGEGSGLVCLLALECDLYCTFSALKHCKLLEEVNIISCNYDSFYHPLYHGDHSVSNVFPRLKKITSVSMAEWNSVVTHEVAVEEPIFPSLEDITLTSCWSSLEWNNICPHIRQSLRRLDLSSYESEANAIVFRDYSHNLGQCLLANSQSFRHLSLTWDIEEYSSPFIRELFDMLELIAGDNVVEELNFTFTFYGVDEENACQMVAQWERLDRIIFGEHSCYPNLKRVTLDIGFFIARILDGGQETGDIGGDHWKMLKEPLQRMREREAIQFKSNIRLVNMSPV